MSLSFPPFCYQKGFWIILGIMVTGGLSVSGWGWALVDEVRQTSIDNSLELAERKASVELIPDIYKNQIKICAAVNADCK